MLFKQEEGDARITKHGMCDLGSCTKTLCAGRVRYGPALLVVESVNCSNADLDTGVCVDGVGQQVLSNQTQNPKP